MLELAMKLGDWLREVSHNGDMQAGYRQAGEGYEA
jgi:hypothetical protein